jgi:cyclophilin family peptidyl-prolyl cis-trans isomerase
MQAPKTCYNFLMLAKQGKYDDVVFHRLVPGFMVKHIRPPSVCQRHSHLSRSRLVTPQALAQEESLSGARLSEMNTI